MLDRKSRKVEERNQRKLAHHKAKIEFSFTSNRHRHLAMPQGKGDATIVKRREGGLHVVNKADARGI